MHNFRLSIDILRLVPAKKKKKKKKKKRKEKKRKTDINPRSPVDQDIYFADSVDPDETVLNEPSRLDLHSLLFCT